MQHVFLFKVLSDISRTKSAICGRRENGLQSHRGKSVTEAILCTIQNSMYLLLLPVVGYDCFHY